MAFVWSLAEMVRDHQSVSEDFVSRDSESSLNNLPTDVSGDGPPERRWFPAPLLGGVSPLPGGAARQGGASARELRVLMPGWFPECCFRWVRAQCGSF